MNMKFALFLFAFCLCVSFISAKTKDQILGDVSSHEVGRRRVILQRDYRGPTIHTMEYPDVNGIFVSLLFIIFKILDISLFFSLRANIQLLVSDSQIALQIPKLNFSIHNLVTKD